MLERLARLVDERSAVWSYGGTTSGFCELVHARRRTAFRVVRRQFAAVHANLAAGELELLGPGGERIGLDPDMTLDHVPGVADGTTLRAWVSATESALLAMNGRSMHHRSSREACKRIHRQARAINAGSDDGCFRKRRIALDDDGEAEDDLVAGDLEPSASFEATAAAGPLAGAHRLRWTLEGAGVVQLDVLDLTGRRVRRLVRDVLPPGTHQLDWDGRDDGGRLLRPGAYFVVGQVADLAVGQRLILLR